VGEHHPAEPAGPPAGRRRDDLVEELGRQGGSAEFGVAEADRLLVGQPGPQVGGEACGLRFSAPPRTLADQHRAVGPQEDGGGDLGSAAAQAYRLHRAAGGDRGRRESAPEIDPEAVLPHSIDARR
jgi:hypothetical protein